MLTQKISRRNSVVKQKKTKRTLSLGSLSLWERVRVRVHRRKSERKKEMQKNNDSTSDVCSIYTAASL
jgi:hypothetical protein